MVQRLDPLSSHVSSTIRDFVLCEGPWSPFPTGSTVSNESSVQNKDELFARVDVLFLTSASYGCFPGTSGSSGQCLGDFGQAFAGSSATDVAHGLSPPSRDTGQQTRSKVSPSAKSFGEICESEETVTAAAPEVRYLACPFSKHDPARYELVWNVCTTRPGWKGVKRVLEHLRKVHSRKNRCERCRTQYPKQIELENHKSKNNCTKVEETNPFHPELMTAEQEKIFDKVFDTMTSEDKWGAYYQFLFPNALNRRSINPYYDYTTLTHRLDPLVADLAQADASALQVRYLACPFSKHDPARYEPVYNSCTTRPGWEGVKRVLEHLRKVHSTDKRCERCRMRYAKKDEFDNHISKNNCDEVDGTDSSRPELMTAEQEKIFGTSFDAMTSEDKWGAYYQFLFPNAPNRHSISPYNDYTTLTHRLDPFATGLTTQKRPSSPPSNRDDNPQSKRQSRGVPATTPQAGSFIAEQSHRRVSQVSAKKPQTLSLITQGCGPYYSTPQLAPKVHYDLADQEFGTSGYTDIASQPSCVDYGYPSGDRKIPSVDQNRGDVEIGASKCMDDASQSTNLDSAYGSRHGTKPSSSNPSAPMTSSFISPKSDCGDSAIAISSNTSVPQSQSGRAVQDASNQIPPPDCHTPDLDPNMPSNILTLDQKMCYGFYSDMLNPDYGTLDHFDQKSV